jgi:signal transduction histidine kinase
VWTASAYIVLAAVGNAFYPQTLESVPGHANPYAIESAKPVFSAMIGLAALCGLVALVCAAITLVLRWRRSEGDERQQLKWFLAGIALLPVPLILHDVSPAASNAAISVVLVIVPVTLAVAVLRHRLYDLDLVVNRSVVYTLVTALVAGVYLSIVGVGAAAVGGHVPLGVHVLAAVIAAAALQPLRSHIQRGVDRLFYGDRSRPYEAVARLGRRLEAALDPDTVLPGVAETITDALRVPYAAIELRDGDTWSRAADYGQAAGDEASFPMIYQGEEIGRLVVSRRSRDEELSNADRRLLEDLARHAGVAAQAVRTTLALQRSRAELVAAREEERRRLRRDLHDGLGPTLAGVTLGLHAARIRVRDDVEAGDRLLATIETQIEEAVTEIRRVVYGLRPPALDEYGLVRAVQLHAARIDGVGALAVAVDAPAEGLGPLPAATEVAAYRIVTEALTNVARHAAARACRVRFARNGSLAIEIEDDGHGLTPDAKAGVGLAAMRERAEELGGRLFVDSSPTGTLIIARLPVGEAS